MVPEEVSEVALGEVFEQHRPRLVAVARRMLGSRAEAEDAVQETWLRLSRSLVTACTERHTGALAKVAQP